MFELVYTPGKRFGYRFVLNGDTFAGLKFTHFSTADKALVALSAHLRANIG